MAEAGDLGPLVAADAPLPPHIRSAYAAADAWHGLDACSAVDGFRFVCFVGSAAPGCRGLRLVLRLASACGSGRWVSGARRLHAAVRDSIEPKRPSPSGAVSRATLRSRLRQHCRGTAEGSTLRLTWGCLLAESLQLRLCAVGRSGRLTFEADGEARLSAWIAAHARVSFAITPEPWENEYRLLSSTSLPLNLRDNEHHPFHNRLTALRADARQQARSTRGALR